MAEKTFSPVRARAATKEAAITQALQMTGASRDEIEIEVLEDNEKGVTVRIAPLGTSSSQPKTASEAPQAGSTPEPSNEKPSNEIVADEPDDEIADDEIEEAEADAAPQAAPQDGSTPDAPDDDGDDDDSDEEDEAEIAEAPAAKAAPAVIEADADVIEHARAHAQEMLDYMGLDAQAKSGPLPEWCLPTAHEKSARVRDVPRAFLNIEGEDVGILIGKHGQTLQSFQYLLNLSLNNTTEDQEASAEGVREGGVHVVVDAGEYRGRRAETIMNAALDGAQRAKRDRRSVRLEPMPAHERRLAHLALHDDKTVTTSSEGREPWRRVVVTPAGVAPSAPREERGNRYQPRSNGGEGRGGNRGGANRGGGGRSYGSGANGGRKSYN
jgi:spoIIIJ-associated protein